MILLKNVIDFDIKHKICNEHILLELNKSNDVLLNEYLNECLTIGDEFLFNLDKGLDEVILLEEAAKKTAVPAIDLNKINQIISKYNKRKNFYLDTLGGKAKPESKTTIDNLKTNVDDSSEKLKLNQPPSVISQLISSLVEKFGASIENKAAQFKTIVSDPKKLKDVYSSTIAKLKPVLKGQDGKYITDIQVLVQKNPKWANVVIGVLINLSKLAAIGAGVTGGGSLAVGVIVGMILRTLVGRMKGETWGKSAKNAATVTGVSLLTGAALKGIIGWFKGDGFLSAFKSYFGFGGKAAAHAADQATNQAVNQTAQQTTGGFTTSNDIVNILNKAKSHMSVGGTPHGALKSVLGETEYDKFLKAVSMNNSTSSRIFAEKELDSFLKGYFTNTNSPAYNASPKYLENLFRQKNIKLDLSKVGMAGETNVDADVNIGSNVVKTPFGQLDLNSDTIPNESIAKMETSLREYMKTPEFHTKGGVGHNFVNFLAKKLKINPNVCERLLENDDDMSNSLRLSFYNLKNLETQSPEKLNAAIKAYSTVMLIDIKNVLHDTPSYFKYLPGSGAVSNVASTVANRKR